ncbi:MAG TPA: hypothetical protein VK543_06175 [Puia sp.]|nr:hypothetical protein [Puia sp.]
MKKTILIASLLFFLAGTSFAQTGKPEKAKTAAKTAPATKATTAAGPAKKDGTADMRYKENKDAAKAKPATTHMKKDGTPDKRYKENKKAS